jgi:hypothetical protein
VPARLIPRLTGWLARHLVAITLLLFVVVGVRLAGGLESVLAKMGSFTASIWAPATTTASAEPPASDVQQQAASPRSEATDSASPPRFIGGVIPIYGDGSQAPAGSGTGARDWPLAEPGEAAALPGPVTRDAARAAYWDGRLNDAERIYLALLKRWPDDPDLFGELGNLYLAQGLDGRAADAYYAAGLRLARQGDAARANRIADLLLLRGDPRGQSLGR